MFTNTPLISAVKTNVHFDKWISQRITTHTKPLNFKPSTFQPFPCCKHYWIFYVLLIFPAPFCWFSFWSYLSSTVKEPLLPSTSSVFLKNQKKSCVNEWYIAKYMYCTWHAETGWCSQNVWNDIQERVSRVEYTIYNTVKVSFVTTVNAVQGISECICEVNPLTRNTFKFKFTPVFCSVCYICTNITSIWSTTNNRL